MSQSGTKGWLKNQIDGDLTYPITRPYKSGIKHFQALVLLGCVLIVIPLTVFNFADSAYGLQPITVNDPNATEAEHHWFLNNLFTFGNDDLYPRCQRTLFNIGDNLITSNFGFRYSITRILSSNGAQTTIDYHNNTFHRCKIDRIEMEMHKVDDSVFPNTRLWSWAGTTASARAFVGCDIENEKGHQTMILQASYGGQTISYDFVAVDNAATHASLWWGTRLMSLYFASTQKVLASMPPDNITGSDYTQAQMTFHRQGSVNDTAFIRGDVGVRPEFLFTRSHGALRREGTEGFDFFNNASHTFGKPLTEALFFAKVFAPAVLADLENNNTDNMLLDEDLLRYILKPDDDFNRITGGALSIEPGTEDWWRVQAIPPPTELDNRPGGLHVAMNEAYDTFSQRPNMGELSTNPARIYTQYLCQIPRRKSTATAMLFTVVATVSLMQAAWALFKWALEAWATRKDEDKAMWCRRAVADDAEKGTDHKPQDREWRETSNDSAKTD